MVSQGRLVETEREPEREHEPETQPPVSAESEPPEVSMMVEVVDVRRTVGVDSAHLAQLLSDRLHAHSERRELFKLVIGRRRTVAVLDLDGATECEF